MQYDPYRNAALCKERSLAIVQIQNKALCDDANPYHAALQFSLLKQEDGDQDAGAKRTGQYEDEQVAAPRQGIKKKIVSIGAAVKGQLDGKKYQHCCEQKPNGLNPLYHKNSVCTKIICRANKLVKALSHVCRQMANSFCFAAMRPHFAFTRY